MRKNTARHLLHGALDLLPVILIPVFMIYSHRHTLTERTEVDIQYKYQSNEVNSLNDLINNNIYELNETISINSGDLSSNFTITLLSCDYLQIQFDETYYDEFYLDKPLTIINDGESLFFDVYNLSFAGAYISIGNNSIIKCDYYDRLINSYNSYEGYDYLTYENFSYTDYNEIESVDVQDTNSSIMNVFMDDFNYSVNKYFNMGNVFNLKDVYHWFEVNIFNNNPPVIMASIYNIIVYEFVMDLLFLLYGLFMWFIDMCKRLMEKPLDSIK